MFDWASYLWIARGQTTLGLNNVWIHGHLQIRRLDCWKVVDVLPRHVLDILSIFAVCFWQFRTLAPLLHLWLWYDPCAFACECACMHGCMNAYVFVCVHTYAFMYASHHYITLGAAQLFFRSAGLAFVAYVWADFLLDSRLLQGPR
jgi:hypothetical protein